MKLKIDPFEFKIIKKPEGVSPKYEKGDKVEYVHDEYGNIKGRINFSYARKRSFRHAKKSSIFCAS